MKYQRYAIYDLPELPSLTSKGASWLGWNALTGEVAAQPHLESVEPDDMRSVTTSPRKYGFHATLKPPFRLTDGTDFQSLRHAVAELASTIPAAQCDGLQVAAIGKFVALTVTGDPAPINSLAMTLVESLDSFRAELNDKELARRRAAGLSDAQEALLVRWGYPYVGAEFNYHITLTGKLDSHNLPIWKGIADDYFELPTPYEINSIALVGERPDGQFEQIERFSLTG